MPKSVLNCSLTASQGKYAFDPVSKMFSWDIGKIDSQKTFPNIRGTVSYFKNDNSKYLFKHFFLLILVEPSQWCCYSR